MHWNEEHRNEKEREKINGSEKQSLQNTEVKLNIGIMTVGLLKTQTCNGRNCK